jgi:hypothetical protein
MSNTDRIRAYYNLHRKCFSVQDYQTGLVIEHTDKLFMTNAMFVVRKSGNERVKKEGKKNVHAFVNGIRHDKPIDTNHCNNYEVKYNPYTMDFFHYKRVMLEFNAWLPVDRHWIGNVWLFMHDGKPNIYADIDKLSDTNNGKSTDTKDEPIMVIQDGNCTKKYYDGGGFAMTIDLEKSGYNEFLRKKRKQIENKKKLLAI